MLQTDRKAKSPYQRYQKTPIKYSPEYQAWRAAAKKHIAGGSRSEMDRLGIIHSRRFGLTAQRWS